MSELIKKIKNAPPLPKEKVKEAIQIFNQEMTDAKNEKRKRQKKGEVS